MTGARSNAEAGGGKVAALGRRAINSFFYRTGLGRPAADPIGWTPDPRWVRVEGGPLEGGWLYLDPTSPAYWEQEMAEGSYDPFIYRAVEAWGRIEGATFWDVGAHIGYHSLCIAALVGPAGHVFSFEPNPFNRQRFSQHLERNPQLAPRVTVHAAALSNANGEATFEFSPCVDDGTSMGSHLDGSSAPCDPSVYAGFERTKVEAIRADALIAAGRVPPPTIMKIDVEGAEQFVLEGAPELLRTKRPLLIVEVHNITQMFHVQKLLHAASYEMEILEDEHASVSRCFTLARPAEQPFPTSR